MIVLCPQGPCNPRPCQGRGKGEGYSRNPKRQRWSGSAGKALNRAAMLCGFSLHNPLPKQQLQDLYFF